MANTNVPMFPTTITTSVLVFNNSGTTPTLLYTAGTNGSKIESILVTNTDTAAYTVSMYVHQSATNYLIGTFSVPLSSGNTTSAPTFEVISSGNTNFGNLLHVDSNGNKYLYVASGANIYMATSGTVTSGKNLTFVATGGDF